MKNITGTLIWYYYICERECWLMAHQINPHQENALLGNITISEVVDMLLFLDKVYI